MTGAVGHFQMSLARKLSLLTGAVIAFCLLFLLGVAYELLTRSAVSGAAASVNRAARQLAGAAEMALRQSRTRYALAAQDPAIRLALRTAEQGSASRLRRSPATDSTIQAAQHVLERLIAPTDSGLPIELWTASGERLTHVGTDQPIMPESPTNARQLGAPRIPRAGVDEVRPSDSLQFGHLSASGGRVYYWLVQPVIDGNRSVGYIAQQRRITTNPNADSTVRALAGEGVGTYYHNSDGTVWSTVGGRLAPPPRVDPSDPSRASRGSDEQLLTASAPIAGTPLVVTMESRVADVLAAPRRTLRLLLVVGLAMLVVGMGAALVIGQRIARPITAIADGAVAIARGRYETRVAPSGEAEIARLAESFNHMANEVAVAHRALEQKTADAEGANRAKSEFLATMSHELRTPLNAIAGYTELLSMGLRGPINEAQRRDLGRIRASSEHLLGLISGVLDLSRIERGQVTYALVPIAIDPFLTDLDALVSPQVEAKSLSLEYVPAERPLAVVADREKLRQIMLNLLSNAIRYTPPGGRITLSSRVIDDTRVDICVGDTGPGIPENRRTQVFEPFVQLDRSLTQPQEGLGLGLAISRDLARGMQGDLTLTENATGGATFVLRLPRAPDETGDLTTSGETHAYRSA